MKINGIYKHYKGDYYLVIDIARHSETLEEMVLYRALYKDNALWVRPSSMFNEMVMVNEKLVKRFLLVEVFSVKDR